MDWQRKSNLSDRAFSFSNQSPPVNYARGARGVRTPVEQSPIAPAQTNLGSDRKAFSFVRSGSFVQSPQKQIKQQQVNETNQQGCVNVDLEEDIEGLAKNDNIKVLVRIRPMNELETRRGEFEAVQIMGGKHIHLIQQSKNEPTRFTFDQTFGKYEDQEVLFQAVGQPLIENVLQGYNSSIFAYGQTGAGKTFTMTGGLSDETRGLGPRIFDFLFKRISQEKLRNENPSTFNIKCSFLEIYNESITDLLVPQPTSLQIREEVQRGTYVEGLTDHVVQNEQDVINIMKKGAENRRVGETMMNRESSRSHAVFTCIVERTEQAKETGVTNTIFSRLHLVDLAGSERAKVSKAEGEHLKETGHINKSLSTLGRVIMELVELQKQNVSRHIPYRDSRLTFLLQDSLGGNAKTTIIANVSPSSSSYAETCSTLHFASRAKFIKNKAVVNQEMSGGTTQLQREITSLKARLEAAYAQIDPVVKENDELKSQIQKLSASKIKAESEFAALKADFENQANKVQNSATTAQKLQRLRTSVDGLMATLTSFEADDSSSTAQEENITKHSSPKSQINLSGKQTSDEEHVVESISSRSSDQHMQMEIDSLQTQINDLADKVAGLQKWSQRVQQDGLNTQNELEMAKQENREFQDVMVQQKVDNQKLQSENSLLKQQLEEALAQLAQKEIVIKELNNQISNLEHENRQSSEQVTQKIDEQSSKIVEQEETIVEVQQKLHEVNDKLTEEQEQRKKVELQLDEVNNKFKQESQKAQEEQKVLENKLEHLQTENLEQVQTIESLNQKIKQEFDRSYRFQNIFQAVQKEIAQGQAGVGHENISDAMNIPALSPGSDLTNRSTRSIREKDDSADGQSPIKDTKPSNLSIEIQNEM